MKLNATFLLGLLAVFGISLLTRTIALGAVNQVVFDEVHFGKFISSYCCTHERFFDIHPPIGKLLIAGGAYFAGGTNGFAFDHIGQEYAGIDIASIRLLPAIAGALLPVIIMILLRQAGVSFIFSLVGGLAVALENSLIVESRFILTDSILLTAIFGSIACAIAAVQTKHKTRSWLWVCLAGILAGIAVGTKFTGAIGGALALVILTVSLVHSTHPPLEKGRRHTRWIGQCFVLIVFAIAVYFISWMLHFSLLTQPGSGDAWGLPTGVFWNDLVTMHQKMLSANYNLTAGHPYGSRWYTWPMMTRSVFYWQGNGNAFIYFLGNPIFWWGSIILFLSGIVALFAKIAMRRGFLRQPGMTVSYLFLIGYAASFIPLMRVPRVLFLYHYLTPLLFSLLFGMWWLDQVVQNKKQVVWTVSVLLLIGFLYISPLTYGFGISQAWQHVLFSISSWR